MSDDVKLEHEVPPVPSALAAATDSVPGPYCRNRLFEWVMAFAMLGNAVTIILSPASLNSGRLNLLVQYGLSQSILLTILLATGALRVYSLLKNGTWKNGYKARALCACVGACLWALMAHALYNSDGPVSILVSTLLAMMAGELRSLWRAVSDAGHC